MGGTPDRLGKNGARITTQGFLNIFYVKSGSETSVTSGGAADLVDSVFKVGRLGAITWGRKDNRGSSAVQERRKNLTGKGREGTENLSSRNTK